MTEDRAKGAKVTRLREPRCPACGKPRTQQWRPFCSKRCADLDLGRWLGEAYRVPVEEEDGSISEDRPDDEL